MGAFFLKYHSARWLRARAGLAPAPLNPKLNLTKSGKVLLLFRQCLKSLIWKKKNIKISELSKHHIIIPMKIEIVILSS